MAIPATPSNMYLQQGNGQVYLLWDITATATSYSVQRSKVGVTFTGLATPAVNNYLDTTVTVGTLYYYQIAATNGSGTSAYTAAQSIVPTLTGDLSLKQVRLMAQQRADMVNSTYVTLPEWNTYINQSYFELYDLLVTTYENYYTKTPYVFQTTGVQQYTLPSDFYKLIGVDCGLANNTNAWASLRRFQFANRNQYVYPQLTTTLLGVFDLEYDLIDNTLFLIPTPSTGQYLRMWYIPKLTQLLQEIDILSGISGWSEYVIVDAAIKAMQKEESDVSVLMAQKMALKQRIQESAVNRDAGSPMTISNTRSTLDGGNMGSWYNGSFAGN